MNSETGTKPKTRVKPDKKTRPKSAICNICLSKIPKTKKSIQCNQCKQSTCVVCITTYIKYNNNNDENESLNCLNCNFKFSDHYITKEKCNTLSKCVIKSKVCLNLKDYKAENKRFFEQRDVFKKHVDNVVKYQKAIMNEYKIPSYKHLVYAMNEMFDEELSIHRTRYLYSDLLKCNDDCEKECDEYCVFKYIENVYYPKLYTCMKFHGVIYCRPSKPEMYKKVTSRYKNVLNNVLERENELENKRKNGHVLEHEYENKCGNECENECENGYINVHDQDHLLSIRPEHKIPPDIALDSKNKEYFLINRPEVIEIICLSRLVLYCIGKSYYKDLNIKISDFIKEDPDKPDKPDIDYVKDLKKTINKSFRPYIKELVDFGVNLNIFKIIIDINKVIDDVNKNIFTDRYDFNRNGDSELAKIIKEVPSRFLYHKLAFKHYKDDFDEVYYNNSRSVVNILQCYYMYFTKLELNVTSLFDSFIRRFTEITCKIQEKVTDKGDKSVIMKTISCNNKNCLTPIYYSISGNKHRHIECKKCLEKTCIVCQEDFKDEKHACNKDIIKSLKLIDSDSKPCPGCKINIQRTSGCNQMWCTICHSFFDWVTNEMCDKTEIRHNPHYFDYLNKNPTNLDNDIDSNEIFHFRPNINDIIIKYPNFNKYRNALIRIYNDAINRMLHYTTTTSYTDTMFYPFNDCNNTYKKFQDFCGMLRVTSDVTMPHRTFYKHFIDDCKIENETKNVFDKMFITTFTKRYIEKYVVLETINIIQEFSTNIFNLIVKLVNSESIYDLRIETFEFLMISIKTYLDISALMNKYEFNYSPPVRLKSHTANLVLFDIVEILKFSYYFTLKNDPNGNKLNEIISRLSYYTRVKNEVHNVTHYGVITKNVKEIYDYLFENKEYIREILDKCYKNEQFIEFMISRNNITNFRDDIIEFFGV